MTPGAAMNPASADATLQSTLFHYTNAHGLLGIIKNREVWATESNYLNDPSEVSFASKALIARLHERIDLNDNAVEVARAKNAAALLERAYLDPHSFHQYREDRAFITSFSRSDWSLTLWRLYAGRNGFSIGFDEKALLRWVGTGELPAEDPDGLSTPDREERAALRANYHLSARVQDVSYGASPVALIYDDVMSEPPLGDGEFAQEARLRTALQSLAAVKHEAYEDEREARLVVQELGHHAFDPDMRVSAAGTLVAYRKIVFPFDAVRSITIAPGANVPQTRHALASLLTHGERDPWGHVEIRQYDVPFTW